jgi:hypothetical protein
MKRYKPDLQTTTDGDGRKSLVVGMSLMAKAFSRAVLRRIGAKPFTAPLFTVEFAGDDDVPKQLRKLDEFEKASRKIKTLVK